MKLHVHAFDLPLRHTFTISRESYDVQPTLIVSLSEANKTGYGEATTNAYYNVSLESLRHDVQQVQSILESQSLSGIDPSQLWETLSRKLPQSPFALSALDQAAHDLWGKLQDRPVYDLWGFQRPASPLSCFTIGIDAIDVMVEKMAAMPGWPSYKIKLGTDHDVEIIRALRAKTDATFRVDANASWSLDEALRNADALAELGVEFIEQPLPANHWEDHRALYRRAALPIMADESCVAETDVARCADNFHGVSIKLVKCGGLTPARRMISQAKQLGLQVMVGCMTESTVGISAIAQLLPMLDYVDMDGAALLAEDIATGVEVECGVCHFPDISGCGVQLLPHADSAAR